MKEKLKEKGRNARRKARRAMERGSGSFSMGMQTGRSLRASNRGVSIRQGIMVPIGLGVAALVAAFVVPVGLDEIVNVSNSNYSSGAQSLWNNLDLFVTLAVLGVFIGYMLDVF